MECLKKQKAYFFDMDGVLFNSMPNHAIAWEEVMKKYGLPFTAYDCYVNEGRTAMPIITLDVMLYVSGGSPSAAIS